LGSQIFYQSTWRCWIRSLHQALRFPLFEEKIHHYLPVHGMKCDGEGGEGGKATAVRRIEERYWMLQSSHLDGEERSGLGGRTQRSIMSQIHSTEKAFAALHFGQDYLEGRECSTLLYTVRLPILSVHVEETTRFELPRLIKCSGRRSDHDLLCRLYRCACRP
jgi:hypothetical protein